MTIVIPMAGSGSRFTKAGYNIPKYLITIKNKSLLQYSLESLPLELSKNIVFIVLKEHIERYNLPAIILGILKNKDFHIVPIEQITRGQAETVMMASHLIPADEDLLIYNIDTYFHSPTLPQILQTNAKGDGIIGYFIDDQPKWSFAKTDINTGYVIQTAEKEVISNQALTGMYHFTKAADFLKTASDHLSKDIRSKQEFYIAPMYNDLIARGRKFFLDYATDFIALGTPEDVEKYRNSQ